MNKEVFWLRVDGLIRVLSGKSWIGSLRMSLIITLRSLNRLLDFFNHWPYVRDFFEKSWQHNKEETG